MARPPAAGGGPIAVRRQALRRRAPRPKLSRKLSMARRIPSRSEVERSVVIARKPKKAETGRGGSPILNTARKKVLTRDDQLKHVAALKITEERINQELWHCQGKSATVLWQDYETPPQVVKVEPYHWWAKIHSSHELRRYDLSICYCNCGKTSSAYVKLHLPCETAVDKLKALLNGKCPLPSWPSGQFKTTEFPPVRVHLYVGAHAATPDAIASGAALHYKRHRKSRLRHSSR